MKINKCFVKHHVHEKIDNSVFTAGFDYCAANQAEGRNLNNDDKTKYWIATHLIDHHLSCAVNETEVLQKKIACRRRLYHNAFTKQGWIKAAQATFILAFLNCWVHHFAYNTLHDAILSLVYLSLYQFYYIPAQIIKEDAAFWKILGLISPLCYSGLTLLSLHWFFKK